MVFRQLIALHVSECERECACSSCGGRLRFLAPLNESHTVPVEHIVVSGDAGVRIAEYAQKFGVDLVVLGSPSRELTEEDLETSTILHVVSNVRCPVLCVPAIRRSTNSGSLIREVAFV
jgi:hypothetical protein